MTESRGHPAHRDLAAGRWQRLSLVEQLAHVGSEVDRAIRANEAGLHERFDRALELFDLTAADERWRGPRRREILRAREEFCRILFEDDVGSDDIRGLRGYFLHFAVAARRSGRSGPR